MQIGEAQIGTLVQKLIQSTASGKTKWEASIGQHNYQCRLGDFVILMRGSKNAIAAEVTLNVKRLSGTVVANISSSPYSFALPGPAVSDSTRVGLERLFSMVDDRSEDLDELIKLLG